MIITEDLVVGLHHVGILCDTGLQYIRDNGYIGTTRTEFIDKIKAHIAEGGCPADYYPWSINTLVKSELIKRHPCFVPTGRFRVSGSPVIFHDLAEATAVLASAKRNNPTTSYLFCLEEELRDDSTTEDVLVDWRIRHCQV